MYKYRYRNVSFGEIAKDEDSQQAVYALMKMDDDYKKLCGRKIQIIIQNNRWQKLVDTNVTFYKVNTLWELFSFVMSSYEEPVKKIVTHLVH